jgi:hypothetical protein
MDNGLDSRLVKSVLQGDWLHSLWEATTPQPSLLLRYLEAMSNKNLPLEESICEKGNGCK